MANKDIYMIRYDVADMCHCHTLGSHSRSCDPITRQCACKNAVGGRRCDRCAPGYWGLALIRDYITGCLGTCCIVRIGGFKKIKTYYSQLQAEQLYINTLYTVSINQSNQSNSFYRHVVLHVSK